MPIKKTEKGMWKIENTKGESKTKKEAIERLKAIKANQSKRNK